MRTPDLAIVLLRVPDVREVLKSYKDKHIPTAFMEWENQAREAARVKRFQHQEALSNQGGLRGLVWKFFGGKGGGVIAGHGSGAGIPGLEPLEPIEELEARRKQVRDVFPLRQAEIAHLAEKDVQERVKLMELEMAKLREEKKSMFEWYVV